MGKHMNLTETWVQISDPTLTRHDLGKFLYLSVTAFIKWGYQRCYEDEMS